jgi:hypothetical protein
MVTPILNIAHMGTYFCPCDKVDVGGCQSKCFCDNFVHFNVPLIYFAMKTDICFCACIFDIKCKRDNEPKNTNMCAWYLDAI